MAPPCTSEENLLDAWILDESPGSYRWGEIERGILVRPGTPLGGPGHIRASYGTPDENRRFLEALGDAV